MRIRGALAALLAASACAQSGALTAIEARLAKEVERTAPASQTFSDLVTKLIDNQYEQGHLSGAWQTLRSAIARAESEGQREVGFDLRIRLADDLQEAGMFAEALAETRAAEATADGTPAHKELLTYRYASCGECEEALRVKRSLPPAVAGPVISCGFSGPIVMAPSGTKFKVPPGTKPEDELRQRLWFARSLHYRKEGAALREHLEETVAFAERNALKSGASDLADVLIEFSAPTSRHPRAAFFNSRGPTRKSSTGSPRPG